MKKKSLPFKILYIALVAVFWLGVWEFASLIVDSQLILPSPGETLRAFLSLAGESDFYITALLSVCRISIGFISGLILGVILGVLCAFLKPADMIFAPLRSIIKSTPVSSFILLLLFWTDRELVPSFISMLIVLPVIHSGVYEGIKSTDPLLIQMANFYKVPRIKQIFTIYTEFVKTRLTASSATALGLAWKAGIAAEVLATPALSIGTELYESKLYLETENLFAWTALVILLSVILEKLMMLALHFAESRRGK